MSLMVVPGCYMAGNLHCLADPLTGLITAAGSQALMLHKILLTQKTIAFDYYERTRSRYQYFRGHRIISQGHLIMLAVLQRYQAREGRYPPTAQANN